MKKRLVLKADVRKEYLRQLANGYTAKTALEIAQRYIKTRASPFYHAYDGQVVEFEGHEFTVRSDYDQDCGVPWDNCDPLGEVKNHHYSRISENTLPRGWVWLQKPDSRHYGYAYNRASAIKETSSWGKDAAQSAARVVDSEIERYRAWLNGAWAYLVVGAELDGDACYCGCVESDQPEHIAEIMEDQAREAIHKVTTAQCRADLIRCFC